MPGFIKTKDQEQIWNKAKKEAKRGGYSGNKFWAVTNSIYQKMSGKESLDSTTGKTAKVLLNPHIGSVDNDPKVAYWCEGCRYAFVDTPHELAKPGEIIGVCPLCRNNQTELLLDVQAREQENNLMDIKKESQNESEELEEIDPVKESILYRRNLLTIMGRFQPTPFDSIPQSGLSLLRK